MLIQSPKLPEILLFRESVWRIRLIRIFLPWWWCESNSMAKSRDVMEYAFFLRCKFCENCDQDDSKGEKYNIVYGRCLISPRVAPCKNRFCFLMLKMKLQLDSFTSYSVLFSVYPAFCSACLGRLNWPPILQSASQIGNFKPKQILQSNSIA